MVLEQVDLKDVEIVKEITPEAARVLTPEALAFVVMLHRTFNPIRLALLGQRHEHQTALDQGVMPQFLATTTEVRRSLWQVAPTPAVLEDRRVEITGPVDRKMMINALNSGARVFMADLEDSLSPTWENIVQGQINLTDAVRRTISFTNPDGKSYSLNETTAVLFVRPRGWHLVEKHVLVDGEPISASLFDFGLYFFHNAAELIKRGFGPYFYLPKLESHLEARLWNDVFNTAQETLGIPRGSIRATVLIETILAAFEMEEILYELRDHSAGLNAGRWDYIFSTIKKFHKHGDMILPDRTQVVMTVPFMRAYTRLLVQTCHRRGAHAIGGMSAFIPSRKDKEVNERAFANVRADKDREAGDGFDGTWVAHPDLVPIAREAFDRRLGTQPHQKKHLGDAVDITAQDLITISVPNGQITEAGVRTNISVALQYLNSWLQGNGAAAINNLMEDAATAEISRSQLWQWLHYQVMLADGRPMTRSLYEQIRDEELEQLGGVQTGRYRDAAELLNRLILDDQFSDFLTIPAYSYLA